MNWLKGKVIPLLNDKLIKLWPWHPSAVAGIKVYSTKRQRYYKDIDAYLDEVRPLMAIKGEPVEHLGLHKGRLFSSNEFDMIRTYIQVHFPDCIVVVLRNFNPHAKSVSFWQNIPTSFTEIVKAERSAFLVCTSIRDAKLLIDTTDLAFADACLFIKGALVASNDLC